MELTIKKLKHPVRKGETQRDTFYENHFHIETTVSILLFDNKYRVPHFIQMKIFLDNFDTNEDIVAVMKIKMFTEHFLEKADMVQLV